MTPSGAQKQHIAAEAAPGESLLDAPPSYAQAMWLIRLLRPDPANSDEDEDDPAHEFLEEIERDVKSCLLRAGILTVQDQTKIASCLHGA